MKPIKVRINLYNLDKSRIFKGKHGEILNIILLPVKPTAENYNNDYIVKHDSTGEERNSGYESEIIGNGKSFK